MFILRLFTLGIASAALLNCGTPSTTQSSSSALSSSSAASSSSTSEPIARCDAALAVQNKLAVTNALNGLFVQKNPSVIDLYWADPYLQHNPIAKSGVDTFRSIMSGFVTQPSFQYELIRIVGECDLVVVQGRYSGTGVIFDMFRLQNGKLMEHWDSEGSQSSPTSGPTAVEDLTATHRNRETVDELFEFGLLLDNKTLTENYFADDAISHHSNALAGSGFSQYLSQNAIVYKKVHHTIADGNFVFVLAEATINGRGYAIYDLFRLDENLIVEHWNSRRAVPSGPTASGLGIF